jgi:DNA-binding response OmpR family regulator
MTTHTGRILVVEDEVSIRLFLEHLLRRDGHEVRVARHGAEALTLLDEPLDMAILDINLGRGMDGIELMRRLRQEVPHIEVVLLTGQATLDTAVSALREGAHDYLFKPCPADKVRRVVQSGLEKRVRQQKEAQLLAQLTQNLTMLTTLKQPATEAPPPATAPVAPTNATNEPAKVAESSLLQHGRVTIDYTRHTAYLNQNPLELTPLEFDILDYLVSQAPRVVSSQDIIQTIHGYGDLSPNEASDVIRTNIYRLRQKMRQIDPDGDLIRTVRGVGYTVQES